MEHVRPTLKTRFIDAWSRVLARAVLKGKPAHKPYREETPPRYSRGSGASWRNVVGGSGWTGKKAAKKHKQWLAAERRVAAHHATMDQLRHDEGVKLPKVLSQRTFNRRSVRLIAKAPS